MKKQFNVTGMSCGHCRRAVEQALNAIDGVTAAVTLDPPVAEVGFSGKEKPVAALQEALSEAGDYTITPV